MKRYVLGIDPGVRGALALVETVNELPRVKVFDMPIRTYYINGSGRARLEESILNQWLTAHAPFIERAVMEEVHSMPKDGPVQAFTFGYGVGVLHALCKAHGIPVQLVAPHTWKKKYGLSSDKDKSRTVASRFFPHSGNAWMLTKHDGRAEAALLGLLGFTEGWGQ